MPSGGANGKQNIPLAKWIKEQDIFFFILKAYIFSLYTWSARLPKAEYHKPKVNIFTCFLWKAYRWAGLSVLTVNESTNVNQEMQSFMPQTAWTLLGDTWDGLNTESRNHLGWKRSSMSPPSRWPRPWPATNLTYWIPPPNHTPQRHIQTLVGCDHLPAWGPPLP